MKAVILAGGLGTRISEETHLKPKPMIEIGGRPILWHIMKMYSHHGVNDFVICCGFKGYVIKEYFANYFLHMSGVTFDMSNNSMHVHQGKAEPIALGILVIYLALIFPYLGRFGKYGDFSCGIYILHFPILQLFISNHLVEISPIFL
jgi:hypothetical protein